MPGPPPTPTELLKTRGSLRANRRPNEPKPPRTAPKCPKHLQGVSRKEWRRMVAMLHPLGLLTSIDGDQLELFCLAKARLLDAEKQIAEDGTIVKSPNGYPVQHPALSVAVTAMKQIQTCLAKFGMNPADRARVHAPPAPEKAEGKSRFFPTPNLRIA